MAPDTSKEGVPGTSVLEDVKGEEKTLIDESIATELDEPKKEQQLRKVSCPAKTMGPFHLLMLPASEQPKAQVPSIEPMMLMDRKLRRDYLSRRFRAYHYSNKKLSAAAERISTSNTSKSEAEAVSSSSPLSPMAARTATATTLTNTINNNTAAEGNSITPRTSSMDLWSGVSLLERALVDCCELPPSESLDDADSSSSMTDDEAPGGSLAKGFEVRFTGLVAKHCHSFRSRILALAILERSLDQDQKDALEAGNDENGSAADTDDDNEDEDSINNSTATKDSENDSENDEEEIDSEQEDSEEESENAESEEEGEDDYDEYNPNEIALNIRKGKRNQQQKRGRGRPPKRAKIIPKEDTVTSTPASTRTLRKRGASNATKTDPVSEKEEKVSSKAKAKAAKTTKSKAKSKIESMAAVEKEKHDGKTDVDMNGDTKNEEEKEAQLDRMTTFFAAGGLKILRSWLMDAMTPVLLTTPKTSPVESEESSTTVVATRTASAQPHKYRPSQYGPMLLPLLVLLSKIPFEMKLIVESKINKQIRRLSKQVNGLVDAFKNQKEQPARQTGRENGKLQPAPPTLETFVDPEAGAGGCVVIQVQEVLDKLKVTWEAHAKSVPPVQEPATAVVDPYESIKSKLKERMGTLNKFEAGKIEKPYWVSKCEALHQERDKKRPRRKNTSGTRTGTTASASTVSSAGPAPPPRVNTQQLALKEREAERIALQDKLKAAQEERKAHLQRLKILNSKRVVESSSQQQLPQVSGNDNSKGDKPVKRKKNGKSVKWKDGLSTDKVRKRDILEEVFLLKEEADPSSSSPSSSTDDNAEKTSNDEPEPKLSPMKSSADDFGLFEMFDCDETLLL